MLPLKDQIWNRACLEAGGPCPMEGDKALAALLQAHGLVMNGGVLHAAEVVSIQGFAVTISGYKYFGLNDAASALELASSASQELEDDLNRRYELAIPDESVIEKAFLAKFSSSPELFAPIVGSQNA